MDAGAGTVGGTEGTKMRPQPGHPARAGTGVGQAPQWRGGG